MLLKGMTSIGFGCWDPLTQDERGLVVSGEIEDVGSANVYNAGADPHSTSFDPERWMLSTQELTQALRDNDDGKEGCP